MTPLIFLQRTLKSLFRIILALLILLPILSGVIGWFAAPGALHPPRREMTATLVTEADAEFSLIGAKRVDFQVRAPDGVILRGWKVRPAQSNSNWVLLYHGVADNRMGVLGQAAFLLRASYSVVMMDARAHGASEGAMATYGWLERNDTRGIVEVLESSETVGHLYALGESMGAAIALQSAAVEPRIEAVAAESSFSNLREAAYDYSGLHWSPWLGKTLFLPGAWIVTHRAEKEAGFRAADVSPEKSVAARPFPVLLICDAADTTLPCRHSRRIHAAARGPKQLWVVPRAFHTAALGFQPEEFKRRVLEFFASSANR